MPAPPTKSLCARCLQSFSAEGGAVLCAPCADREAARAARAPPAAARTSPLAPAATEGAASPEPVRSPLAILRRELRAAREWCDGRMPWFRLPLWIYLAWTFGRHLAASEPYRSLFDGINLGIHEFGHAIFRPLGTYAMIAGGTITQLAAPLASLAIFRWQRDFFGVSVGLCWLATNLWGISVYAGDARALRLPLVAPGMGLMPGGDSSGAGGIIHDWNYLLGGPGLLKYDTTISGLLATLAVAVMLAGLALGAWLLARMMLSKSGQKLDWSTFR
jgi:hypothetical protein